MSPGSSGSNTPAPLQLCDTLGNWLPKQNGTAQQHQPNLSVAKKSATKLLSTYSNNHPSCAQAPSCWAGQEFFSLNFAMTTNPVCSNKWQTGPSDPTHFLVSVRQGKKLGFHTQPILLPKELQGAKAGAAGEVVEHEPDLGQPGEPPRGCLQFLHVIVNVQWCHRKSGVGQHETTVGTKLGFFAFILKCLREGSSEEQSCIHPPQHQQQIPAWTSAEGYFARKSNGLALFGLLLFGLGFRSIWSANSTAKKLNSSKGKGKLFKKPTAFSALTLPQGSLRCLWNNRARGLTDRSTLKYY